MKPRLYMETTIPSLLVARPSKLLALARAQASTKRWWRTQARRFDLFASPVVVAEVSVGDSAFAARRMKLITRLTSLELCDEADRLAAAIMSLGMLPEKARTDAMHVALSAVYQMDILLTWNMRHINNRFFKPRMQHVCEAASLQLPRICTPSELLASMP